MTYALRLRRHGESDWWALYVDGLLWDYFPGQSVHEVTPKVQQDTGLKCPYWMAVGNDWHCSAVGVRAFTFDDGDG